MRNSSGQGVYTDRIATARIAPQAVSGRIRTLAAIALLGLTNPVAAETIFWPNLSFEQTDPETPPPAPKKRVAKRTYPKLADTPKDIAKPRGPLIVVVSIEKQLLKIYDGNGLFAETPVSTGMRGHETPMGVFSIIQKSKWHRSNLYSDAPMPFMQRITWSGVALHAGVLPGHPASHGCIRMPMAFATKLWSWSKLGARVVIAPGDLSPADITHPLLMAHASATPVTSNDMSVSPIEKSNKMSASGQIVNQSGLTQIDLRLTPAHDNPVISGGSRAVALEAMGPLTMAKADGALTLAARTDTPLSSNAADGTIARVNPDAGSAVPQDSPSTSARPAEMSKAPPIRGGHIAVLISGKDSRMYVRQNFEPVFDVPVTISPSSRRLGTHIFTARSDSTEPGIYSWSTISLPSAQQKKDARAEDFGPRRKRSALPVAEAVAAQPEASPAEALDRLTIPAEAIAKIEALLSPGASIVVSDKGMGDETGSGTDFIIPLR